MQISCTSSSKSASLLLSSTSSTEQDSQIQSIQKQIESAKKELQSVSNDDSLSTEEKRNQKTKLQQQISDLNNQISQRKIEIQQEKLQTAKMESLQPSTKTENTDTVSLSDKAAWELESDNSFLDSEKSVKLSLKAETEEAVIEPVIYTKTGGEIPQQQDGEPILDTLA